MQLSQLPPNYESVRSTFTTRITATERFYIRNHFAPPTIDPRQYRLTIAGLVRKPLALSLEELSRMRQVEMEAVLQCAGNGRALFRPRVPGVQWSRGAVGNATWRGVRLAELLHRAGADPQATMLQLTGADMPILPTTPRFVRGLPTAKALHEDTIVALAMNDAPLAPLHGAPVRLVVPGWVADGWTKWLTEVTVQNTEPTGFYYQTAYRYPIAPVEPGAAVPPEKTRPMEQLNVKSIVGSHEDGDIVEPGEQAIVGVAFAGEAGIRKVDVTVDGGRTWAPAKLDASASRYGFTRFTYRWQATPGATRIASRAEDRNGRVQPETPAWNPSGYLYNAIDPVAVEVRS
jgi:DMSO/TMAO reductase YedYZ molybdopterin-dependent catalytic subunit